MMLKILVALIVKTKKINVYWKFGNPQEISQNLKNLLDNYGVYCSEKDHGVGKPSWFFSIENKVSLQNLKDFVMGYKDIMR